MSEIQEKQPYVFNHESKGVQDGIGIPEPRFDEIIATAKEAYRNSSDTVQAMEYAMNKIDPTIVEATKRNLISNAPSFIKCYRIVLRIFQNFV